MALEQISYRGWPTVYRLANASVEVLITADIGPRIIRYGFIGGENILCEVPNQIGTMGGDDWRIYGGHRLWHSPENNPRTYYPDNNPVTVEEIAGGLRTIQATEPTTGLQKVMEITLDPQTSRVALTHRIVNHSLWPVELSVWALSVMADRGVGIVPQLPKLAHPAGMLPNNQLILWPYTELNDPRWTLGSRYFLCRQDPQIVHPQKIGLNQTLGWAAYARGGDLFVKQYEQILGATYPDYGASFELFTNDVIFELETLSPLIKIQPESSAAHREAWHLFTGVPLPTNDADVDANVLPKVQTLPAL